MNLSQTYNLSKLIVFPNQPVKLAMAISLEDVKVSTVSKEPVLDFSSYGYAFENMDEAKEFVLRIKRTGMFPSRKNF